MRFTWCLLVALFAANVHGQLQSVSTYELAPAEVLAEETWLNAQTLLLQGTVKDDFFFLANEASLESTHEDEVWGFARKQVLFSGTSTSDIRLASTGLAVFSGTAEDGLMLWASTCRVETNAIIRGSTRLRGDVIVFEGRAEGNVTISAATSATVRGYIQGTLTISSPDIALLPGTRIEGDLLYHHHQELLPPQGVLVTGELRRLENRPADDATSMGIVLALAWVVMLATSLSSGALMLGMFPIAARHAGSILAAAPVPAMLAGCLSILLGTAILSMALWTVVGLPIALVLLALLIALATLGQATAAHALGCRLLRLPTTNLRPSFFAFITGTAVHYGLLLLPFVGPALWFLMIFMGSGSILMYLSRERRERLGTNTVKPES